MFFVKDLYKQNTYINKNTYINIYINKKEISLINNFESTRAQHHASIR